MKRKFLFALLSIAAMLTGCSQENVESFTANKTTSFKVAVDEGVQTRAGGDAPTRYIMEMYEGATTDGTPTRVEQAANTFDVILKDAQAYTVLFWADYGTANGTGNEYDAASLKAAKVATGKQASKAAFAGKVSFTTGTDDADVYTAVTLKHSVAQVNFKQTEALTSATNTLTVNYPESYSINVTDNSVTKIDGAVTHTFTYNNTAIGALGTDYIIAATGDTKTIMEIEAILNSEAKKTIPNVSFGCNYRTNISGAYSNMYSATLTASCDDEWETPDNEATLPEEEPEEDGNFVEVNGIKVAVGNLVAKAGGGCEIGTATDGGLFFQFGSLIGWSTTGSPTIAVKPANFKGEEGWAETGKIWQGTSGTVPLTVAGSGSADEIAGIGDPCRYYLGDTWRLPTNDEYKALFNNVTDGSYVNSGGWSWNDTPASATHTDDLAFPASGYRGNIGGSLVDTNGCFWSASPFNAKMGYILSFGSSNVDPSDYNYRAAGMPVRCVRD